MTSILLAPWSWYSFDPTHERFFSKSLRTQNTVHAVAPHFVNDNFCRIHGSLRVTPAMEAGIADHVSSLEEVIGLLKT
jgi:hypothetical protein